MQKRNNSNIFISKLQNKMNISGTYMYIKLLKFMCMLNKSTCYISRK